MTDLTIRRCKYLIFRWDGNNKLANVPLWAANGYAWEMGQSKDRTQEEVGAFEALIAARWPKGFICPRCHSTDARRLERRLSFQCNGCRYQCRILSGTKLEGSRIPLQYILASLKRMIEGRREEWSNPGHWRGGGQGRKLEWVQTESPKFLGYMGNITVRSLLSGSHLDTESLGTAHRFRKRVLNLCAKHPAFRNEPDHERCFQLLLAFLMESPAG